MNEVEKMYENAGINKIGIKRCSGIKQGICQHNCNECESFDYKYPLFTAEKQIHIIKWLSDKADYIDIHYDQYKGLFNIQTGMGGLYVCNEFEQALASRVNTLWQDLTEEEKTSIKNILE